MEALENAYGEAAQAVYSRSRAASENGELIFGASVTGESMAD